MIDVRQILAWSDAMRARWWKRLEEIDGAVLAENREASFRSVCGILTHMANVENGWMDVAEAGLEGETVAPNWARHSTKTWSDLAPVREYAEAARARTHKLVDGLTEDALQTPCPVKGPFARDAFTVEEILYTLVTHECFHRGEVLAILWQRDIEPPVCDYPAYGTSLR